MIIECEDLGLKIIAGVHFSPCTADSSRAASKRKYIFSIASVSFSKII
jgi:hypothetical protein